MLSTLIELQRLKRLRQQLDLVERIHPLIRRINNNRPVPIQKNRAPFYFVLSHFVCADFSAG